MLEGKTTDDSTTTDNVIELGKLKEENKNQYEEKLEIPGCAVDDDYSEEDLLQSFQPVAFYFLKRDKYPRLLFVKLVSWSYPFTRVVFIQLNIKFDT